MQISKEEENVIEKIREIKQNAAKRPLALVTIVISGKDMVVYEGTPRGVIKEALTPIKVRS